MKVNKNTLYAALFLLCVAVPYLNNYELTFAIWTLATALSLRKSYNKHLLYQLFFFSSILVIATISAFFHDFKGYDFIRDFTYIVKPILGLLVGYQLARTHLVNPIKTLIVSGFYLAIIHLVLVAGTILFVGFRDIHLLRFYAGYFSDFEIYALILLWFSSKFQVEFTRQQKGLMLIVLLASTFFYLSRINFIQAGILFLALKGFFTLNKRLIIVLATGIILILGGYFALLAYNPIRNGKGADAFLYKIKVIPEEAFKTRVDASDWKDFNDNYRSVENILTVKQMGNSGTPTILFGKGLGSRVDLKQEVELDGTKMKYISIVHNGYMTTFLKSGLLGVILLISSILVLRKAQVIGESYKMYNRLLIGTVLFLFLSYWVFLGFYFKADTKSIILGLILACYDRIVLNQQPKSL